MLDAAVADTRLARNPAVGVKLPRIVQAEHRYLTHDQVGDLAEACGRQRTLVFLLAYCGLRWGEAAALRVRRVDLLRGRLTVAETMTEVHGQALFGTPKTHQTRSVPVPRFLREQLGEQLAGKAPDELVFTGSRRWRDASRELPTPGLRRRRPRAVGLEGLTPHELATPPRRSPSRPEQPSRACRRCSATRAPR